MKNTRTQRPSAWEIYRLWDRGMKANYIEVLEDGCIVGYIDKRTGAMIFFEDEE